MGRPSRVNGSGFSVMVRKTMRSDSVWLTPRRSTEAAGGGVGESLNCGENQRWLTGGLKGGDRVVLKERECGRGAHVTTIAAA